MGFASMLKNRLVTYVAGGGTALTPVPMYLALYNGDPEGTGIQVHTRVEVSSKMGTASGGQISNASEIAWPRTTVALGVVTHVALFDAASGGTLFGSGQLSQPVTIGANVTPTIPVGAFIISLA